MVYVFIVILVGIALLILQQQKKSKYYNETKLVQCAQCGIYIAQHECITRRGKHYCIDCK